MIENLSLKTSALHTPCLLVGAHVLDTLTWKSFRFLDLHVADDEWELG